MYARGTAAIPLAPRPRLEQYRKLAKDLLKAWRTGEVDTVRAWAGEWIGRLARLQSGTPTPEYLVSRSSGELDQRRIDREVHDIVKAWQTDFAPRATKAGPKLADAQWFIAWLHGFESWPKFVNHIGAREVAASPVARFESAADAIATGNAAALGSLLHRHPELIQARSTRDHHATLLHYVAANGHEGFRQRTPQNAVEIARLLLDAGADADALADMYEHRCTTMQMVVSSTHPHVAGVQVALVDVLVDYGAAVDGVGNDSSPLMTALRFHFPAAAQALVRRGARVDNILAASALGRVDLVEEFVRNDGTLRPGVVRAMGPWPSLSADPKQHLGYALTWACSFGHDDVVELLLRKGVDPTGQDNDASAVHFAAAYGRMNLVRLLVSHGASLETLNSYGGTVLSGTLYFAYHMPVKGVDYSAVVRNLIEMGAKVDIFPGMKQRVDAVLDGSWRNEQ